MILNLIISNYYSNVETTIDENISAIDINQKENEKDIFLEPINNDKNNFNNENIDNSNLETQPLKIHLILLGVALSIILLWFCFIKNKTTSSDQNSTDKNKKKQSEQPKQPIIIADSILIESPINTVNTQIIKDKILDTNTIEKLKTAITIENPIPKKQIPRTQESTKHQNTEHQILKLEAPLRGEVEIITNNNGSFISNSSIESPDKEVSNIINELITQIIDDSIITLEDQEVINPIMELLQDTEAIIQDKQQDNNINNQTKDEYNSFLENTKQEILQQLQNHKCTQNFNSNQYIFQYDSIDFICSIIEKFIDLINVNENFFNNQKNYISINFQSNDIIITISKDKFLSFVVINESPNSLYYSMEQLKESSTKKKIIQYINKKKTETLEKIKDKFQKELKLLEKQLNNNLEAIKKQISEKEEKIIEPEPKITQKIKESTNIVNSISEKFNNLEKKIKDKRKSVNSLLKTIKNNSLHDITNNNKSIIKQSNNILKKINSINKLQLELLNIVDNLVKINTLESLKQAHTILEKRLFKSKSLGMRMDIKTMIYDKISQLEEIEKNREIIEKINNNINDEKIIRKNIITISKQILSDIDTTNKLSDIDPTNKNLKFLEQIQNEIKEIEEKKNQYIVDHNKKIKDLCNTTPLDNPNQEKIISNANFEQLITSIDDRIKTINNTISNKINKIKIENAEGEQKPQSINKIYKNDIKQKLEIVIKNQQPLKGQKLIEDTIKKVIPTAIVKSILIQEVVNQVEIKAIEKVTQTAVDNLEIEEST